MTHATLTTVWQDERRSIVAALARRLGDLDLAEEAVQEAAARAALVWPEQGPPDRPGAWLTTTAWRIALDDRRRGGRFARYVDLDTREAPRPTPDDELTLILTCAHPALNFDDRVALTLRHVVGLSVAAIAAALLLKEGALAKRLTRARTKLRDAGVAFAPPTDRHAAQRLDAARQVLYVLFSEGHSARLHDGPPVRTALCEAAIRLARDLVAFGPDDPESRGLLALFLFAHARTATRLPDPHTLVPLADQDRAAWNPVLIAEARRLLAEAHRYGTLGPYQLEAAIAALHAEARTLGTTRWPQIADLYDRLAALAPSPVVTVNRAVAVGYARGAHAGLACLAEVDDRLAAYAPYHAARAELLEGLERYEEAAAAWTTAADLADHPAQQSVLHTRIHQARAAARAKGSGPSPG